MGPTKDTRQLNWFLAWAVVFCDIGTSVYYVPGILYSHVKDATPFFVLLTTGGFILLSLKYIEISWRNPEGGGVVTITTKAFGPMWGCLGGMLIIVDYFLTTAISAVAGLQYIGSVRFPRSMPYRAARLRRGGSARGAQYHRHPRKRDRGAGHGMRVFFGQSLWSSVVAIFTMDGAQWSTVLSKLEQRRGHFEL